MPVCPQCTRFFYHSDYLHAHCRSEADHHYCVSCERLFNTFEELRQHVRSTHWSYSTSNNYYAGEYCRSCNRNFIDQASLLEHLATSTRHNWCFLCSRDFSSPSALDKHANSRVHHARDFSCPLCKKTFKVPSAIAHHIESGACHNIPRHLVTKAVQSLKIAAPIALSHRIEYPRGSAHISYTAGDRAWNGYAYECYLCHRTFNTLVSLNSHLASPVHDADEFGCPKCKRRYKLVSGLIQHIESEVCGIARFQEVQQFAHDLSDQFKRLLTF